MAQQLYMSSMAPAPCPPAPSGGWTARLNLLLESTGEGIFGVDLDGRCTFINRAAAGMLGYRTESVLGRNMHELMHRKHADGRAAQRGVRAD